MQAIALLAALLLSALILAMSSAATAANDSAERDVVATVQQLLDAWREANVAKASEVLHADFREVTLHENDGAWSFSPVSRDRLLGALGGIKPGEWDDRLLDPKVLVEGPIAVVWSRYRFRTPGPDSAAPGDDAHCGIETFQLYRIDDRWKIVNFADTHAACEPGERH